VLNLDPKLPALLEGDAGRVRQVVLNLGTNAVKFTPRGEVTIAVKVLDHNDASTYLRCEVRDTGMGIPAHRLSALFAPFTQVDSSMTRRFGGTGLGLSIVRRLVQLMGGEVGVDSVDGVGSTFWFTLRLTASAAIEQANATVVPSPASRVEGQETDVNLLSPLLAANAYVLLAEDNPVNQKVASRLLEKLGYRFDVVSNGHEAVEAWQRGDYDLILMDCQMPLLDGYQAAREIRRLERGTIRIPIVALTAHAMQGADEECRAAGMDNYLTKPIDRYLLAETLAMYLSAEATVTWKAGTRA
jgi:CheY-like chemotaxis protein